MAAYYFERECRTPQSEVYNVLDGEAAVGRVDLHYTATLVHATLCVNESLTQEMIQELIEEIDEELVDVERPAVVAREPGHVGGIGGDQQLDAARRHGRPRLGDPRGVFRELEI